MSKRKPDPRQLNGNARRKLKARLKALGGACAICGRPIDYSLPPGDPWSFEVDEIRPVSRWREFGYDSPTQAALDPLNVQPSHRLCNQRKGDGSKRYASHAQPVKPRTSRQW